MRVKHIMTKDPTSCVASDTAQKAASIMRDEDAGIVPVIENEQSQKVIGVVTDRDLCMNVVAEGRDPRTVRAEECMTTAVVTCSPNDSVEKATELMKENQIRRVPVVDEGRKLLGIVSMADLVARAELKTGHTHETLKTVSTPTPEPSKPRARSRRQRAA
jgi:CBS domain-containing protein